MSDIIQLLPDSVANQIAAGEVIQRPASAVKELVENALDAGADEIVIYIKDAGKTSIKIVDNGCGMSPADARTAFERHATSKISSANDLFSIRTMGFRGEALASVAAIADVELRSKRPEDEVGIYIHITGSAVISQEPVACNNGTAIIVKNLFFNVPARRRFLKSNTTELKHIINEIQRVALPNPDIRFLFYHNYALLYDLGKSNMRRRIADIFGKNINQSLIPVGEETSLVKIAGFIGQPKYARKTMGEQFFFVNKRYMRHPYFHKAVMQAYEKLLPSDSFPSYFLMLDIEPGEIDINIHPTKTEIKFENDSAIWQIINATVRESLGKHNVVPSIDFDMEGSVEIPIRKKYSGEISFPEVVTDPDYNPFTEKGSGTGRQREYFRVGADHWESLYNPPDTGDQSRIAFKGDEDQKMPGGEYTGKKVLQLKQKYILTPVKSGIMVIDQKRAHERILYEKFMEILKTESIVSQQELFPQKIELDTADSLLLKSILDDLLALGFDIREFGTNTFVVNGTPGLLDTSTPQMIVEKLLEEYKNSPVDAQAKVREQVAGSLAKASALDYGIELKREEADRLIDKLFACETPNYSPDGKKVLTIIPLGDIEKFFNI